MAKLALLAGIAGREFINNNFPFEQLTVKTGGRRIAGLLRSAINKHWSTTTAKEHFHNKAIVDKSHFDMVYWDGLECAFHNFPKMFRVFVTKHVSKFCRTN